MNNANRQAAETIKILVIGDAEVGKSSFIDRYVNDYFTEKTLRTFGVDFLTKHIDKHGGRPVNLKIQFWDIAGQERYALLTRSFFMYARGCLILFDLTNSDSFENVKKWKRSVDAYSQDDATSFIPCLLVANKHDLSPRKITTTQIEKMCQDQMFVQWTETSARDGINVNEAVNYLIDVILGMSPSIYTQDQYEIVDTVCLSDETFVPKRKTCKNCI